MANRQQGYGFTKEVSARIDAKYSTDDEREIVAWMTAIIADGPAEPGRNVSSLCLGFSHLQLWQCFSKNIAF